MAQIMFLSVILARVVALILWEVFFHNLKVSIIDFIAMYVLIIVG